MNLFKRLYEKHKDVIPYLFFGVCTTQVNVVAYWICARVIGISVMPSTITAWFLAVLFANFTNRKWVFFSKANGIKEIPREIISFFACRSATGVIDWLCMYIFVDILMWNDVLIKILANMLVIVLNYVASKMLIFRKQNDEEDAND